MKFIIEKRELSSITSMVHRAASTKNTIPVLSGLLIEVSNEKGLVMTATDMEIGIKASTKNVEIIKEGTVLVNAHYFSDFIKLLPDSQIQIELNQDKAKLNISYGRSSGFINIYSDYEYPDLPLEKLEYKISVPQKVLREAFRKTSFAAAMTHFRQVFTGVLFDLKEDGILRIVASDTHRLAHYTFKTESKNTSAISFIVPTRSINELMRIIDDNDDLIDISFSENNIIFSNPDFILLSRIIDGQYPNYEQVIPKSSSSVLLINAKVLSNTLERAKIMPTDDKTKIQHVQFIFSENEAKVESFSEIMGEIQEVIEDLAIEGEKDFKIAFNTNYFLDIVKILNDECEQIRIELSGSLGPVKIVNPAADNYLYVLVPLRTSN
ncbi:MAG TPA: DNA polymerase III subunit beta [Syntrophomonadaceae bacterium]|nr:DNA polymerase III subunit beta [Syntrophomonadaceae bacterium]HRX20817.1 DNA polymerase III subunit beta [Syntrophomonadaceae bacterium]